MFFWFIDTAKRLRPKVVVAENVKGILLGNAKGYVNQILKKFDAAGYDTQIFLLNAATMGVPQRRERAFFIARRKDLPYPRLKLAFSERPVLFGEVRDQRGKPFVKPGVYSELLKHRRASDTCIADIALRVRGKESGFNNSIESDGRVASTAVSSGSHFRMCDGLPLSDRDYINIQTFPQDYDFMGESAQYVCGMSVPPVMMAHIAGEIARQWFDGG